MSKSLLSVNELTVAYDSGRTSFDILDRIDLTVAEGETLGIVGESGCGKSLTSLAVMGLLSPPLHVKSGSIEFGGKDITRLTKREMNRVRGKDIAMIFQEPMTSLNPVFTVGNQIAESMKYHLGISDKIANKRAVELLDLVGIPSSRQRVKDYPHQMSGGMRQRVMIAMALACDPKLLIADEPTTALDVTIQAQILNLLKRIKRDKNMSMIFITHDLGVLSKMADRVMVMYGGKVIETASTRSIFEKPLHPYTQGLWKAIPGNNTLKQKLYTIPGTVPAPQEIIPGCRFASRCEHAWEVCRTAAPAWKTAERDHNVACHLYGEEVHHANPVT